LNGDIKVRRIKDADLRWPSATIVEELCFSHSSSGRIHAANQVTHSGHVTHEDTLKFVHHANDHKTPDRLSVQPFGRKNPLDRSS
jgi:hypothetical protein